jgi:diguanylate cyclase (GGDEF)-like protein
MENRFSKEKILDAAVLQISQSLTSQMDLEKILNMTSDLLLELFHYSVIFIILYEERDKSFKIKIEKGVEGKEKTNFEKECLPEIIEKVNSERRPLLLSPFKEKKICNLSGIKTVFLLPLLFEENIVGIIYMGIPVKLNFSTPQLRMFHLLSNQIAIAVKNANLYLDLQNRLEEISYLYQASKQLSSTLKLEELLKTIVEFTVKTLKADSGYIFFQEDENGKMILRETSGIKIPERKIVELKKNKGLNWVVATRGEPVLISDFSSFKNKNKFELLPFTGSNFKSILIIPIKSRNRLEGVLGVIKFRNSFSEEDLRLISIITSIFLVSIENAKLYQEAEKLSITDGLTKLYNHRYFQERLSMEIKRIDRYQGNLSLIMADIDYFKKINDLYGHAQGDLTLQEVGELIKKNFRETDIVARYGGEEFAIILPETNSNGAKIAAERLRKLIEEHNFTLGKKKNLKITISCGIAEYPAQATTKEELIKNADMALYKAKKEGKNKVVIWEE